MLKNLTGKVFLIIFAALFVLSGYFSIHSYYIHINSAEDNVLSNLHGIAKTLSAQMDGHKFKMVLEMFPEKDGVTSNDQHPYYLTQHEILKKTKDLNNLQTSIYTLTFDSVAHNFFFGITSEEQPFFRHEYNSFPKELIDMYETGGMLPTFEDQHGTWLTSFAPVKDGEEVIGVVVVDMEFSEFIAKARTELIENIAVSLAVIIIVALLLFRVLNGILRADEQRKALIKIKNSQLEAKNREITSSLWYAKRIQEAMLPSKKMVKAYLDNSFIFYKPKDIVAGDFYWMHAKEDEIYFATADCTGHGVPGAMVSVVCSNALDRAVNQLGLTDPSQILDKVSNLVQEAFDKSGKGIHDGMDICFCRINLKTNKLCYCGANSPLYHFTAIDNPIDEEEDAVKNDQSKLIVYKTNKQPVGKYAHQKPFVQKEIQLLKGDALYAFSDGFADQFGGPKGKKFRYKPFKELLLSIQSQPMDMQRGIISEAFDKWKGEEEQVDDVCVMGIKIV